MICSIRPGRNRLSKTAEQAIKRSQANDPLCRTPFCLIACSLLAPSARKRADLRRIGPAQESDKLTITDAESGRLLQLFLQFLFQRRCISARVVCAGPRGGVSERNLSILVDSLLTLFCGICTFSCFPNVGKVRPCCDCRFGTAPGAVSSPLVCDPPCAIHNTGCDSGSEIVGNSGKRRMSE